MDKQNFANVMLYGHLAKFGRKFRLAVNSPAEAIHALRCTIPGFKDHLVKHAKSNFKVLVGEEPVGADDLLNPCGTKTIKIVPVVAGAKSDGIQMIVGAVLVVVGLYTKQSWLVSIGISMIAGGVSQMLSGTQAAVFSNEKGPSDTPTYSFSGPQMTYGQGNPVPVLLGGPLRIGGALLSVGLSPETWQDKGFGGAATDNAGTVGGNGDTSPWVWAIAPEL
jgi:predicted phage tail protein